MKHPSILVILALALTLSLPAVAAASPPNPCGEMHRKVDVDGLPLCGPLRPVPPRPAPVVGHPGGRGRRFRYLAFRYRVADSHPIATLTDGPRPVVVGQAAL